MRYSAYHICKPSSFINALKAMEGVQAVELHPTFYSKTREGAEAHAKHIGGATIVPVSLRITNPFFNNPNDPFVEMEQLVKLYGRDKLLELAGKYEYQLVNTDFWHDLKTKYGEQLTLKYLFMNHIVDFYCLPLEMRVLVEDVQFRTYAAEAGYDGFIYGSMAPDVGGVIYYPLNLGTIRYGEEEAV